VFLKFGDKQRIFASAEGKKFCLRNSKYFLDDWDKIMAKTAFNEKRTLFTSTMDLELRKNLVKCYVWNIALYGAEILTLRAVDQKHLESFKM
jgi:hypothetical protein